MKLNYNYKRIMNNREKVIKFLNKQYQDTKINPIMVSRSDIEALDISEKEIIQILNTLDADRLIIANPMKKNKDFNSFWKIILTTECLNYFFIKKSNERSNRRSWVNTYIPILFSATSLIVSIIAILITTH